MKYAVVLCLFVCVHALSGCSQPQVVAETADTAAAPTIDGDKISFPVKAPQLGYLSVEAAEERNAVATRLNGRLAWDDDVTSRIFPPVSGRIVEILANPGESVSAGDLLAKIRSPEFGQAQSDTMKTAAELKVAERALHRSRELLLHGAAAQKDVDTAEADYARALSEEQRARATLSLYGGAGPAVDGFFSLKAPIAGVVVEKAINPGQEVRSDQVAEKPLFVISDPSRLWMFLDVTDEDAAALHPGQEVVVRARALADKVFHGRVEIVGEGLDASTRTLKVRCSVDNSEKLLRAEMYVSAEVTSPATGVVVSTKAVFLKHDAHYVFVETTPGTFERRAVELGGESNGHSAVMSGLTTGEQVVTDGSLLLNALLDG
ncbi:MAG TPA: efflux RND transporter periplasmic adaptor subunit [Candidatus Acidoferrales bacterium]|nr:efflux RND transporter periplasmic adaptor subunit [Candidatus Acidoferrales bacterium]